MNAHVTHRSTYTRAIRTSVGAQDSYTKAKINAILDIADARLQGIETSPYVSSPEWAALSDDVLELLSPTIPESGIHYMAVFALIHLCNAKYLFETIDGVLKE